MELQKFATGTTMVVGDGTSGVAEFTSNIGFHGIFSTRREPQKYLRLEINLHTN